MQSASEIETHIKLDEFPCPENLWKGFCSWRKLSGDASRVVAHQDYYTDAFGKSPRYYQLNAINSVVDAVDDIEDIAILKVRSLTEHGTPPYVRAVRELEDELFRAS